MRLPNRNLSPPFLRIFAFFAATLLFGCGRKPRQGFREGFRVSAVVDSVPAARNRRETWDDTSHGQVEPQSFDPAHEGRPSSAQPFNPISSKHLWDYTGGVGNFASNLRSAMRRLLRSIACAIAACALTLAGILSICAQEKPKAD